MTSALIFALIVLFQANAVIAPPKIVNSAVPVYPAEARQNNISGTVWVKVRVNESGVPLEAVVVKSSNTVFNTVSTEAAMKYRFYPGTKNSNPVDAWITIPFRFSLYPSEGNSLPRHKRNGTDGGKIPGHYKVD
jgi:TonB family protein